MGTFFPAGRLEVHRRPDHRRAAPSSPAQETPPVTTPSPLLPLDGPFELLTPTVTHRDGRSVVRLPYRIGSSAGPLLMTEEVELPVTLADSDHARVAVRLLHLLAGVSYYKCVVPTPLVVPALSDAERALLEGIYDHGLRELAHRHGLPVPVPVELREQAGAITPVIEPGGGPEPMAGSVPP